MSLFPYSIYLELNYVIKDTKYYVLYNAAFFFSNNF